jgi:protein TonB
MEPASQSDATNAQARSTRDSVVLAGQVSPEENSVAEEVAAARLIHRVEPEYPAGLAPQRAETPLVLSAEISPEGAVQQLSVVEGDPILAESAMQAVRQWRYKPYIVDGHPVGIRTNITLRFKSPSQ